jgi:hypothetical protein
MIFVGYIQKTIKADLHVRRNNAIPPQNLREKVLEDSWRLSTEADPEGVTCGPPALWAPPLVSQLLWQFPTDS